MVGACVLRIRAERQAELMLGGLEARLDARPYLASQFSIAEVSLAPSLTIAPMLQVDLSAYPGVRAWLARIAERPAWKKVYG